MTGCWERSKNEVIMHMISKKKYPQGLAFFSLVALSVHSNSIEKSSVKNLSKKNAENCLIKYRFIFESRKPLLGSNEKNYCRVLLPQ